MLQSVDATLSGDSSLGGTLTSPITATLSGDSSFVPVLHLLPAVISADLLPEEGLVLVFFDSDLCIDSVLLDPGSYVFSGPTSVEVRRVKTVDSKTVVLATSGLGAGAYTVTASTSIQNNNGHHLSLGNNQATFPSSVPLVHRSVFTDKGPITKPELTLQSGSGGAVQAVPSQYFGFRAIVSEPHVLVGTTDEVLGNLGIRTGTLRVFNWDRSIEYSGPSASSPDFEITDGTLTVPVQINRAPFTTIPSGSTVLVDYSYYALTLNEVILPGGSFTTSHVGLYVELGGSSVNGGTYRITGVLSATRLRLLGSFQLPDPDNGSITWRLYDPRTGEIADSASDVVARINGAVVGVQAVVGLLGQVILPVAPGPADLVSVDYSWIKDPTVEIHGLNSREFRLNNWNTNLGIHESAQHTYRYRNVLTIPSTYQPTEILAAQEQPLLRQLFYRAYERAYSAVLNDPNLLRLNSPAHRIAFPPLSREVPEVAILYSADVLPEADPTAPWERRGVGLASIVAGNLVVEDNTTGPFPTGNPFYWTREIDLTFPHVYAATWRMKIDTFTADGIFTGVSTGWSDGRKAVVLGFLYDGSVRKIGFLKKGKGNLPSELSSWTGGLGPSGGATGLPFDFDWSILHSYRFLRDQNQVVRFYVDGELVESLRITEDELPFLEELNDCFEEVQNVFFGSLSREAMNQSTWDFVRYVVLPLNPSQTSPSIYVNYNGDLLPEEYPAPWTPVGYHGYESLAASRLIVDSVSATTLTTAGQVGLIGGDFRGFTRIEPLLQASSDVVLDFQVVPRTYTNGVSPNSVMVAIDDGSRLVQLCFFPTAPQPKFSYAGRSMPQAATPRPWTSLGTAPARMVGRTLRIEDTSATDGRVFALNDLEPPASLNRVIEPAIDFLAEFRCQVLSYTADPTGFCGATVDVFDGNRTVGLLLRMSSGIPQVSFHSDGQVLSSFNFSWNDNAPHTYRLTKNTSGNLVVLFIDNVLIGTYPYTNFHVVAGIPTFSFGSYTALSSASLSVVDWYYVNAWRAQPVSGVRRYVGLWKGTDSDTLLGYHLPLKRAGNASVSGNTLTDGLANFVAAGLATGDDILVDYGPNRGIYSVATVVTPTVLTIAGSFPSFVSRSVGSEPHVLVGALDETLANLGIQTSSIRVFNWDRSVEYNGPSSSAPDYEVTEGDPTIPAKINRAPFTTIPSGSTVLVDYNYYVTSGGLDYRVPDQIDWTIEHKYRVVRDPGGTISLLLDAETSPRILVAYNEINLPPSSVGIPFAINRGLPSVTWGAMDPTNLSQTSWGYVRYGVTRPPEGDRIVPHHQLLNQRNVMSSPEHLFGTVVHNHTQYSSASTGVPYPWEDFVNNPAVQAFTQLNERTPLVPSTQSYEVRSPSPEWIFISSLNTPADVLNNSSGFLLNDSTTEVRLVVPDDVLYSCLEVVERETGAEDQITPFTDSDGPVRVQKLSWTKTIVATYDGTVLPEYDPNFGTPWVLDSDYPSDVHTTVAGGILTYSVGPGPDPNQTVYRNASPLPDSIGLTTTVDFRLRLLNDSTSGGGDTGVRFGFSALGLTAALAFVAAPITGEREVKLLDLSSNTILGSISLDYLDGLYHTYRLVKNAEEGTVDFLVDP
jgi:hypothetical protein